MCNPGRMYFFPEETHEFYDALMEFVFSTLLDICDVLFSMKAEDISFPRA